MEWVNNNPQMRNTVIHFQANKNKKKKTVRLKPSILLMDVRA